MCDFGDLTSGKDAFPLHVMWVVFRVQRLLCKDHRAAVIQVEQCGEVSW